MKTEKPILQQNKAGMSKLNFFQKLILFLALMLIAFTVLKPVVILFLGLLPTMTIVVTDTKNINKITTVGCFNMAGVMICLKDIYEQFGETFSLVDNIFNIITMLVAAAVGVFLYYVLPDLFAFIFKNSAQHRLKIINAKLERLQQTWANILPEDR